MFVATLSLGEALWSPQFYAYTYEIAPEGNLTQKKTYLRSLLTARTASLHLHARLHLENTTLEGTNLNRTGWRKLGLLLFVPVERDVYAGRGHEPARLPTCPPAFLFRCADTLGISHA